MCNIYVHGLLCVVLICAGKCETEVESEEYKYPIDTEEREFTFDLGCQKYVERQEAAGVPSNDQEAFRQLLGETSYITVVTGNEISSVSGVPVLHKNMKLRGKYNELLLLHSQLYAKNPSTVWEFFHKMREMVLTKEPNAAHIAIANFEKECTDKGKNFTLITQTVDSLHVKAGSWNVHEMYGSVFKSRCTKCLEINMTRQYPLCEALRGKGDFRVNFTGTDIPENKLPHCKRMYCKGLLLPYAFIYPNNYPDELTKVADFALRSSKVIVLVGDPPVLMQTAAIALAVEGAVVALFNDKPTFSLSKTQFYFEGPITDTIPAILKFL